VARNQGNKMRLLYLGAIILSNMGSWWPQFSAVEAFGSGGSFGGGQADRWCFGVVAFGRRRCFSGGNLVSVSLFGCGLSFRLSLSDCR